MPIDFVANLEPMLLKMQKALIPLLPLGAISANIWQREAIQAYVRLQPKGDRMGQSEGVADFMAFMARNGFSNTTQRRAIAEAFFAYPGHHTLEEFYHHVSQIDPSIGQTTVYRTLKLLCSAGLASEIQFADNVARYEVARPKSHHDHLVCLKCGKIIEIFDPRIENIQAEIACKHDFTLSGHTHNLYGTCANCRKTQ